MLKSTLYQCFKTQLKTPTCFGSFVIHPQRVLNVLDWNYSWYFCVRSRCLATWFLDLWCVCLVRRVGNYTATSLRWISLGLTFSACKNRITPRTSQSAGFDIGAFIVTTRYTHNVKKFAAPTAPDNYLHSTEHTTWLIWHNETTARVVCANVLYFPNIPRTTEYTSILHLEESKASEYSSSAL